MKNIIEYTTKNIHSIKKLTFKRSEGYKCIEHKAEDEDTKDFVYTQTQGRSKLILRDENIEIFEKKMKDQGYLKTT